MRISVLGTGAMGARMARRLKSDGHAVRVWNRSPGPAAVLTAEGFAVAPTPAAAAEGADVVLAMVRDDVASQAVWLAADGALQSMQGTAVAIDSSTLTPGHVAALADRASAAGVVFVEAPVVGSRPQAEAGQLIFLLGGSDEAIARAEPALRSLGTVRLPVGAAGAAAVLKLAVNSLFALQVAALAELLPMMAANGIPEDRAVAILGELPPVSPAARGAAGLMLTGRDDPLFPIALVEKDLGYAAGLGSDHPMLDALRAVLARAGKAGLSDRNLTAVRRLYG